jgi:hypothetical protein
MAPASDEPSEIAEASGCYLGLDQIQRQLVRLSSPYSHDNPQSPMARANCDPFLQRPLLMVWTAYRELRARTNNVWPSRPPNNSCDGRSGTSMVSIRWPDGSYAKI